TSSIGIQENVNVTIDGNGLVLDGQSQTFDIFVFFSVYTGPGSSSLTLNDVTVTNGFRGIVGNHYQSTVVLNRSAVTSSKSYGIHATDVTLNQSIIKWNGF